MMKRFIIEKKDPIVRYIVLCFLETAVKTTSDYYSYVIGAVDH